MGWFATPTVRGPATAVFSLLAITIIATTPLLPACSSDPFPVGSWTLKTLAGRPYPVTETIGTTVIETGWTLTVDVAPPDADGDNGADGTLTRHEHYEFHGPPDSDPSTGYEHRDEYPITVDEAGASAIAVVAHSGDTVIARLLCLPVDDLMRCNEDTSGDVWVFEPA